MDLICGTHIKERTDPAKLSSDLQTRAHHGILANIMHTQQDFFLLETPKKIKHFWCFYIQTKYTKYSEGTFCASDVDLFV